MSYYDKRSDKGMKNEVTRIKWMSTNEDDGEKMMTHWWPNKGLQRTSSKCERSTHEVI